MPPGELYITRVNEVYELSKDALILIKDAQAKGIIHRTPLYRSDTLSSLTNADVYLKLEALQKTGSFKVRGAYNAVTHYINDGVKHVVTASAGNHAQGVAYAAKMYGLKSTIVMPKYTPWIKISNTKKYGAEVILEGQSYYEAEKYATELAKELKAKMIHAYDDPFVIAGQGTIGWEIIEDLKDIDYVIVPVGGGGLISGIASVIKTIKPSTRVIGVQSEVTPSAYLSLKQGRIITVDNTDTIADGIAVKKIGDLTFDIMQNTLDDVVLVSDQEIVNAILILAESAKVIAEGAGAVAVAALLSGKINVKGNVVAIVSGGNIDVTILAKVLYKGLVQTGRLIMLKGLIPDRPGMLAQVTGVLGRLGVNIVEIRHERYNPLIRPNYTEVDIIVEAPPEEGAVDRVIEELSKLGFNFKVEAP
ncbi:threonine ammonia-lyase [Caldivirga sp. UBA161]|uniref:threonine ammonia-lyase n=1 Tax=Caldivirga sp. UBA161 TaxID=1915569 RepID=UPI0025BCAD30|nr:threonine ammonia-lyase [Caldivirga sp. UBA161]